MAKNTVYMWTESLPLVCTAPTTPQSGDPVLFGQLPGVALTAEDSNGVTTVALNGTFDLSVKGETTTDAAIAAGDILYYDTAATPHKLNKDSTNGVRFGYAMAAVSSGATTTIPVRVGY
ncbi:capsid cement protein [Micromonospora haikouensis]|uniref:capsid cement protein n=1 Tax=Micromonospora haikouensis TaxID=686309 RepID=UPI0036CFED8B